MNPMYANIALLHHSFRHFHTKGDDTMLGKGNTVTIVGLTPTQKKILRMLNMLDCHMLNIRKI